MIMHLLLAAEENVSYDAMKYFFKLLVAVKPVVQLVVSRNRCSWFLAVQLVLQKQSHGSTSNQLATIKDRRNKDKLRGEDHLFSAMGTRRRSDVYDVKKRGSIRNTVCSNGDLLLRNTIYITYYIMLLYE